MNKISEQKRIVKMMIEIYCKKKHKGKTLCDDCGKLLDYANSKTENCPFNETKTFCSNCAVHCYQPEMRDKIKTVMRFSGPLMVFYHPIIAFKHIIETKRKG